MAQLQRKLLSPLARKSLGRGLGALIAEAKAPAGTDGLMMVPIESIKPDHHQPRKQFDESQLDELAASLKQQGMLSPLLVRREGKNFRLIAGERRWRAAQRAGFAEVPVMVREASDDLAFEWALVENLQRSDLNPLEEAEGYKRLMDLQRWTQEQVAERVGKDRSSVANSLRLLALPNEVKQKVGSGDLSMGHAKALLALSKNGDMVVLARQALAENWSVRELEAQVRSQKKDGPKKGTDSNRQSPEARRLVEDLQRRLGTKVQLKERGQGKGSLSIEFFSYEDLDRIVGLIRR